MNNLTKITTVYDKGVKMGTIAGECCPQCAETAAEYCYSYDGEIFYDTELEAHQNTEVENNNEVVKCYRGVRVYPTHQDIMNDSSVVSCIIEELLHASELYREGGCDTGYLDDLIDDKYLELESLIVEFLNKNARQPDFYVVTDVEEDRKN